MKNEFSDLLQADEDFEGDAETEKKIKDMLQETSGLIATFEKEIKSHQVYQREQLEEYNEADFTSPENYKIIAEIREFKKKLKGPDMQLDDIKKKTDELNALLIG